jgi:hypothetical protein
MDSTLTFPKHGREPVSLGDDLKNPKTVFVLPDFASIDFSTLEVATSRSRRGTNR